VATPEEPAFAAEGGCVPGEEVSGSGNLYRDAIRYKLKLAF
jgi:hypothetical protein